MMITMKIETKYKNWIKDKASNGGRRPGLHVSDIVDECLRKPWYRMSGLKGKEFDHDTLCNFYYGTAIHESFDGMFEIMEKPMCVNPFEELIEDEMVNIEKEMKLNPFKWVSGSVDAIHKDEYILDFKTCQTLPNKVSERYVRQVNFYSYMYYLYTDIEIKKGAILYLEKESGFKKHKVFEFDLKDVDSNRFDMINAMSVISEDNIPNRNVSTLCTDCPYRPNCKPTDFFDYKKKTWVR